MTTEIESNGSIGTANLLTASVQMTGQSSGSSDLDYFKLYNSGSGTAQFTVTLPNNYANYNIKIYDSNGTLQKSYTTYNTSETYSIPSTSAGYSYISVNSTSTADYSITANFIADKVAYIPTYQLSTSLSSVDEGSTATFTLSTTNVTAGTSVPYTISGLSAADVVGGALSGSAVVNTSGQATITVALAADVLTEGAETLTLTAGGASASMTVNDTSTVQVTSLNSSIRNVYISGNSFFDTSSPQSITTDYRTESSFGYFKDKNRSVEWIGSNFKYSNGVFPSSGILNSLTVNNLDGSLKYGADNLSISIENLPKDFGLYDIVFNYKEPAYIYGTSGNDQLFGRNSGTYLFGGDGNDTLVVPVDYDSKKVTIESDGFRTINFYDSEWSQKFTLDSIEFIQFNDKLIDIRAIKSLTSTVVTPTTTAVTSIPYGNGKYFIPTSGADNVAGTAFIDVVKASSTLANNLLTKLPDGSWQVQNKFTPSNSDNLVNVERVEFSDMSVALDVSGPAGQVAKILGSVFGPSYVNNTVFAGIGLAYLDGGMSYLDLCGLAAGAAGLSSSDLLVSTLLRNATGSEPSTLSKATYLQSISNGASYASVVQQIADSSVNTQSIKLTDIVKAGLAFTPYILPATYNISATSPSVNEGLNAVFNLTTTNVSIGTEVTYTLSGINSSDVTTGILTGKSIVGTGGLATISIPISSDGVTEGQETITISAQGATASIVINDTSKGNATPAYALTPATSTINEGVLAQVYVSTTNVAAGTSLQFGISGVGITQGDVIEGLSRFVTVDSTGKAVININTVADQLTEGPETMNITLGSSSTSIVINDTSVSLVGVINTEGGDGGGGGGGGAGGD